MLDQLELSLLWLGPHVSWACSLAGLMVMMAKTLAALPPEQWTAGGKLCPTLLSSSFRHSPTCCTTGLQTAGATLAKAALISGTPLTVENLGILCWFTLHTAHLVALSHAQNQVVIRHFLLLRNNNIFGTAVYARHFTNHNINPGTKWHLHIIFIIKTVAVKKEYL